MTTFTGEVRIRQDETDYTACVCAVFLIIIIVAMIIGAFGAGILTGMQINRKEYERRDAIRLIHDLEKHGGQME